MFSIKAIEAKKEVRGCTTKSISGFIVEVDTSEEISASTAVVFVISRGTRPIKLTLSSFDDTDGLIKKIKAVVPQKDALFEYNKKARSKKAEMNLLSFVQNVYKAAGINLAT